MTCTIHHPWTAALSALLFAVTGCTSVSVRPAIQIEAISRGAIRPVNIRIERVGDSAVLRGSVYAGPGYRSWQRHHLLIEVLQPDEHIVYRSTATFSPQPLPRIVRSRGRAHFSAALPQFPPTGSIVRITPRSGPLPNPPTSLQSHD